MPVIFLPSKLEYRPLCGFEKTADAIKQMVSPRLWDNNGKDFVIIDVEVTLSKRCQHCQQRMRDSRFLF